jgi:RimJ/RimL family protein N-acetyltransferase
VNGDFIEGEGQMSKDVRIVTDTLILRTVMMDDIEDVALNWKLDEHPISHEEAEREIRWMLDNHERNITEGFVHLCLAIINRGNGEFIGWCGLDHRDPT